MSCFLEGGQSAKSGAQCLNSRTFVDRVGGFPSDTHSSLLYMFPTLLCMENFEYFFQKKSLEVNSQCLRARKQGEFSLNYLIRANYVDFCAVAMKSPKTLQKLWTELYYCIMVV